MKTPLFLTPSAVALALLATTGCTSTFTEGQRLRQQSDANQKTVKQIGNLKLEGETKTANTGARQTQETSASISFKTGR